MADPLYPPLITRRQLAQMLSVTTRTISAWVAAGRLPPPIRLSQRSPRWRADTITQYLRGEGAAHDS